MSPQSLYKILATAIFSIIFFLSSASAQVNTTSLGFIDSLSLKTYCTLTTFPFFWVDNAKCNKTNTTVVNNTKTQDEIARASIQDLYNKVSKITNTSNLTSTTTKVTNNILGANKVVYINTNTPIPGPKGDRGENGTSISNNNLAPGVAQGVAGAIYTFPVSSGNGATGPQGPAGANGDRKSVV